jgi:hypothetical protein
MAQMKAAREKGYDLENKDAINLFRTHIDALRIAPGKLFALNKVTEGFKTSDWAAVKKALPFLSDILDKTLGMIPHARSWKNQFHSFLLENKINWSPKDVDVPIDNLRIMLQSLSKFKKTTKTTAKKTRYVEHPRRQISKE